MFINDMVATLLGSPHDIVLELLLDVSWMLGITLTSLFLKPTVDHLFQVLCDCAVLNPDPEVGMYFVLAIYLQS